jgi:hypothetical protein
VLGSVVAVVKLSGYVLVEMVDKTRLKSCKLASEKQAITPWELETLKNRLPEKGETLTSTRSSTIETVFRSVSVKHLLPLIGLVVLTNPYFHDPA